MALAGKNGCSCDLRGTHCNRASFMFDTYFLVHANRT